MYIDSQLVHDLNLCLIPRHLKTYNHEKDKKRMVDIIENCGVWYTLEALIVEIESDISIEQACKAYYFVIDKNAFSFTEPDAFLDDVEEYLRGELDESIYN